jgi:uncharacterized protein YciI
MSQDATYLLLYTYVEDMAERRGPYRDAHLERIRAEKDAGRVTMAGALGNPQPDEAIDAQDGEVGPPAVATIAGGAIVFQGVTREDVERFTAADPYVQAGLVTERRIVPWTLV